MTTSTLRYRYDPLNQNIICNESAINDLPSTVDGLGASRAMITCGPTILSACDVVPRVQEALGSRYVGTYSGVAPHSPVATVEAGAAMAQETQPDIFISVGGGSTHDTTKAIATFCSPRAVTSATMPSSSSPRTRLPFRPRRRPRFQS